MKALVVDDEKLIVKGLKFSLEQDGYEVDCAYDGQEAIDKARDKEYDIMLLDLMLPVFDGYQVCQQVREFSDVPIIMLTAKGEDMDKILGLEYGADDYITKPFNILEVKARIKAIIRRNRRKTPAVQEEPKVIVSGSMRLDIDAKRLYIDEKEIRLTVKEFDILKLLISHPGQVFSSQQIYELVWKEEAINTETIMVHIRKLRLKIEKNPQKPQIIPTVWGKGYRIE